MLSQVLQVNVRLSEGGAAGVARTLADELRTRGISSPYAYGYSKGGSSSALEGAYDAIRLTPKPIAAANRLAYSVIGRETRMTSSKSWGSFTDTLAESDVVHLHAIHSHIVDTDILVDALIEAGKPVVWTMHDQWAMTGRCAQPGSCRLWETGCQKCPDLGAYPPAKVDHASRRWSQRRRTLDRLQEGVPTAFVACAAWLGAEARKAGLEDVRVIRNSVDRPFWEEATGRVRTAPTMKKVLFMCRDLRDRQKVDWRLLDSIALIDGIELTIMGDDAPQEVPGANMIPAATDRQALARIMLEHNHLLFTSQVDYYPLTVVEALTCNLRILALDSAAVREFRDYPNVLIFSDVESIVEEVADLESQNELSTEFLEGNELFAPQRMAGEYVALYEELSA